MPEVTEPEGEASPGQVCPSPGHAGPCPSLGRGLRQALGLPARRSRLYFEECSRFLRSKRRTSFLQNETNQLLIGRRQLFRNVLCQCVTPMSSWVEIIIRFLCAKIRDSLSFFFSFPFCGLEFTYAMLVLIKTNFDSFPQEKIEQCAKNTLYPFRHQVNVICRRCSRNF